ncbi:hypothetical protein SPLC1_S100840 [Arthrospira platensis C1]|nr:hypothetical protein SPLC1_S100840 [Arthrospira platensis C1]
MISPGGGGACGIMCSQLECIIFLAKVDFSVHQAGVAVSKIQAIAKPMATNSFNMTPLPVFNFSFTDS